MATTTTTQVGNPIQAYDRTMLRRAEPYLVHTMFGQKRPLPKGGSKVLNFRRYDALTTATTPLTEGTTPAGSQLSTTDISATVAQYGDYVTITDMVDMTVVDPVLTEAAEVLGQQAGETLDEICRDVLVAGTSVSYSNGAARSAVTTLMVKEDISKAVRLLKNNSTRFYTKITTGVDKVGTVPVRPCYIGIIHPDITFTVEGFDGFKSVEQYAGQTKVHESEIGSLGNVRFIESPLAKVWADAGGTGGTGVKSTTGTNADVYATLIFGMDAYGITELKGEGLKNFVKALGSAGTSDPINQRSTSGWKATVVYKILNDAFITRIESAAAE